MSFFLHEQRYRDLTAVADRLITICGAQTSLVSVVKPAGIVYVAASAPPAADAAEVVTRTLYVRFTRSPGRGVSVATVSPALITGAADASATHETKPSFDTWRDPEHAPAAVCAVSVAGDSVPQNGQTSFCFAGFQTASPPQDGHANFDRATVSATPAPWRRSADEIADHAPGPVRVALEHRTTYRFDRPVTVNPHVVRLRPAPHCRTPIAAYSLTVAPDPHFVNWQQDPQGNWLARFVFP